MGIGRLAFLKRFGAALASGAAGSRQAVVVRGDVYVNRALGVGFTKPRGWTLLSARQFEALRHDQVFRDEELSEVLRQESEPLAVVTRGSFGDDDFEPAITVYVEPLEDWGSDRLVDCLPLQDSVYQRILKDYRRVGEPRETTVSGCDAIDYGSEFLFEVHKRKAMARCRTLIVVRAPQMYTVALFDYPELGREATHEFDRFVSSFCLV